MKNSNIDYLEYIMSQMDELGCVDVDNIPNIDLYMDQVTTFMDRSLGNTLRRKDEDKVLTKTMINNYAKNKLIPAPEKKKYSKEHIISLLFIYYFKGVLTISDIQELLSTIADKSTGKNEKALLDIYEGIVQVHDMQIDDIKKDIAVKSSRAREVFGNPNSDKLDKDELFGFISLLSFDVYYRKLIIERLIDNYYTEEAKQTKPPKKEKTSENKKNTEVKKNK